MRLWKKLHERRPEVLIIRIHATTTLTNSVHSGICFVTPADRHDRKDVEILEKRHQVYLDAKASHPERWTGITRNWKHIGEVALNKRNNPAKNDRRWEKGSTVPLPVRKPTDLILSMKEQKFLMAENGPPKKLVGGHGKLLRVSR